MRAGSGLTAVVAGTSFGARVHARALAAAGFDVRALVGRDPERTRRRAERAGIPHAFTSLDEALAAAAPEVVAVVTPPVTHGELTRIALEAGCHVMCEKPFTIDAGEARQLSELGHAKDRVCYLGHEFRYAESAALMQRLIGEGAIGEPRLGTLVAHNGMVAPADNPLPSWWFDELAGGGWLGASGSHAVDRIRQWLGEVISVSAMLSVSSARVSGADDTVDAALTTTSGARVNLQTTAAARGPGLMISRVVGREGTVWIEDESGLGNVESALGPVYLADSNGVRAVPVPSDLALPPLPGLDPRLERNVLPYVRFYEQMARAIGGDTSVPPGPRPATFADGVTNMRVLDAMRDSSALDGATIHLA